MHYLKFDNFENAYQDLLRFVLFEGTNRYVRGFQTREISPILLVTDNPLQNILSNSARKINKSFMVAEFLWIALGRQDVDMVSFYNKNIANFSDNGKIFNGAYGPKIMNQLGYIGDCFRKDINTRQAVITIWERNPRSSKDIPCTIAIQFLHREGKLDMIVNMRSNDIWLGLPYDFYNFTMIQNYAAFKLGLKIGRYSHFAGSLHLYDQHYEVANYASADLKSRYSLINSEVITTDELSTLSTYETNIRIPNSIPGAEAPKTEPWISMAKILENKCVQVHKT